MTIIGGKNELSWNVPLYIELELSSQNGNSSLDEIGNSNHYNHKSILLLKLNLFPCYCKNQGSKENQGTKKDQGTQENKKPKAHKETKRAEEV